MQSLLTNSLRLSNRLVYYLTYTTNAALLKSPSTYSPLHP